MLQYSSRMFNKVEFFVIKPFMGNGFKAKIIHLSLLKNKPRTTFKDQTFIPILLFIP